MTATETFVILTGQRDNIGDSLLRRGLLASIPTKSKRHVLLGADSEDYATGLGLVPGDVIYADRRKWMASFLRTALRRRVCLVLNAGEISPDRAFIVARLMLLPLIWLLRLRGGAVIQAGLGVRNPLVPQSRVLRWLIARAQLVTWRDEASRAWAGRGTVAPDWAFMLGPGAEVVRERHNSAAQRRMVLSLRGDRPQPTQDVLDRVRAALAATGATPVIVCQVRRDGERCEWLVDQLGGEAVLWPSERSHVEQELVLRAEYARATWVASDRLHVLVAAMTEGAVPLDALPDPARKVARTLSGIDLVPLSPDHAQEQLDRSREVLRAALAGAHARLRAVAERVDAIVEKVDTPPTVRVLHSMRAPDSTTRYATHMAATEDLDVRPQFFSWARALFGRYERFHLHWPEHLVPSGTAPRIKVQRRLAAMTVARLARRQIPVVRTLHNLTPHGDAADAAAASLHQRLDLLTQVDIHLVEGDPARPSVSTRLIPHGSYREPYAIHPAPARLPGRILFFGMIKRYKGVPELLAAFGGVEGGTLRVVGAPADGDIVSAVQLATASDPRITAAFGFISDADLAAEIGAAELVALPYRQLHSSGVVLVALSLGRPVLVPRTTTTESLLREVGPAWVRLYDGELTAVELETAQQWASRAVTSAPPDLTGRSWAEVRLRHGEVYSSASARHLPGQL